MSVQPRPEMTGTELLAAIEEAITKNRAGNVSGAFFHGYFQAHLATLCDLSPKARRHLMGSLEFLRREQPEQAARFTSNPSPTFA